MSKVFELRIYKCKPKYFADFLNITNQKFHLRTQVSKLVGYWVTEIGGINEVVHIWEYDNLKHRQQVRLFLGKNEEWKTSYLSQIKHMWDSQENNLLTLQDNGSVTVLPQTTPGYFLLQRESSVKTGLSNSKSSPSSPDNPILIGDFKCVIGDNDGDRYRLFRHQDLDLLLKFQTQYSSFLGEDVLNKLNYKTKLMSPTMFSPLQ